MTFNPGEVVALLGASGSGKTTLLGSVAGLERPSRGRNNHLPGKVTQFLDGRARLEGEPWQLWGAARGALKVGDPATGIICLERTRIAAEAGANRLAPEVVTGMFLGDRKDQLFKLGALWPSLLWQPPSRLQPIVYRAAARRSMDLCRRRCVTGRAVRGE